MRVLYRLVCLAGIASLVACASSPALLSHQPPAGLNLDEIASVPFFPQEANQCGPAALATVLSWAGSKLSPEDVAPSLYLAGRKGSLQVEMVANARRQGYVVIAQEANYSALWQALSEKTPILVLENLALSWWPKWHYAVVVGFDPVTQEVLLRSGTERLRREKLAYFNKSWELANYWMMSIHDSDSAPDYVSSEQYVEAANNLIKTGLRDKGKQAAQTATQKWPETMITWMNLGNLHYQDKEYRLAENAYRRAATAKPQHPAPPHNLAWALIEQGRFEEARVYAGKAVSLSSAQTGEQSTRARYQSAAELLKSRLPQPHTQ